MAGFSHEKKGVEEQQLVKVHTYNNMRNACREQKPNNRRRKKTREGDGFLVMRKGKREIRNGTKKASRSCPGSNRGYQKSPLPSKLPS